MAQRGQRTTTGDRVTVSLEPGQRDALETIAARNHTSIAFVVRYALRKFIEDETAGQLRLQFPGKDE